MVADGLGVFAGGGFSFSARAISATNLWMSAGAGSRSPFD
jgi:hypothetical protein